MAIEIGRGSAQDPISDAPFLLPSLRRHGHADEEGKTLSDQAAARDYALRNIRELICDEVKKGRLDLSHRIDIEEEQFGEVTTVRFSEAVIIDGQPPLPRVR